MANLSPRILLMLDFDHTIIDNNSDTWIKSLLPDGKVPPEIRRRYHKHNSWTDYMGDIFRRLHELGVCRSNYESCFQEMPFTAGMKDLLRFTKTAPSVDIIIASDSNSFFISCILEGAGLGGVYEKMYTNEAQFDGVGCLKIRDHHSHDCKRCPRNLCKGQAVREHLAASREAGLTYQVVGVVGDGSNDYCPCTDLDDKDFVFPRCGYSLCKEIQQDRQRAVNTNGAHVALKATVLPWDDACSILEQLKLIVDSP